MRALSLRGALRLPLRLALLRRAVTVATRAFRGHHARRAMATVREALSAFSVVLASRERSAGFGISGPPVRGKR